MIRVNLLASDLERQKRSRLRRRLILAYALTWIVVIVAAVFSVRADRTSMQIHQQEIDTLIAKIDAVSPGFKRAVALYQERVALRSNLAFVIDTTVEPQFVLQSLLGLSERLPEHVWLEEMWFSAMENTGGADNQGKPDVREKSMVLTGNLFVGEQSNVQNPVQTLCKEIQRSAPFSFADGEIDLTDMRVKKINNRYAHDFVLRFRWHDVI